ncbi:MAG: asparagine synthetase B family protein, partial [Gammaproteobacteria bacterium]
MTEFLGKKKRRGDAMEDRYFRARQTGTIIETKGTHTVLLGHQLYYKPGAMPDGIFAKWEWGGARLIVRNDRYGFYPLFYYCRDGEIGVSPSISRLVDAGAPIGFDYAALAVFLRLGYFIGEDTPFKHIRALPPGATLEWDGAIKLSSDGYAVGKPCTAISRDQAMDAYIALFRQ